MYGVPFHQLLILLPWWLLGAVLIMLILVVTYIVDWNSFIQVGLFCALCLGYLLFLRTAVSATCRALLSGSVCLSYYCVTSDVRANIKYVYTVSTWWGRYETSFVSFILSIHYNDNFVQSRLINESKATMWYEVISAWITWLNSLWWFELWLQWL